MVKKYIFNTVAAMLFVFPASNGEAQEISRVIAKVNNEVITSKDFEEYLEAFLYRLSLEQKNSFSDEESIRKETLNKMIEDKLILAQAKKDKIDIPHPMIEDKFDKIVSAYSSLEEFEKSLMEKGLTITALKEKIKEQYLCRQIVDIYVESKVTVAPKEISQYYQEHLDDFSLPRRYVIWIAKSQDYDYIKKIGRLIDTDGVEKAQAQYAGVLLRMESPENELRAEIADVLLQIRQGDYFIRNIEGLAYLVFFEGITAGQVFPLEDMKEKIYSKLRDDKMRINFAEWIEKLKSKALVEVYQ